MFRYTIKRKDFESQEILLNNFSFSPADHREVILNELDNDLNSFTDSVKTGLEIGSDAYTKKSKIRFIKTNNISSSYLLDSSRIEYSIPQEKVVSPNHGTLLIVKDGGTGGLGEICLYEKEEGLKDYISAGIIELNIKDTNLKYFILGVLKSFHFKEYMDCKTPGGSTIRHSKLLSLGYKIPSPKTDDIKNLLSFITQNIVDKEQKIKIKNKEINDLIRKELEIHSHVELNMPFASEIQENNFRFDSGLYSSEYKGIKQSIEFYEKGYFNLLDKFNAKRGQNLQISNIGISIYSDVKKDNFYKLVTRENFDNRVIKNVRYLGNKNKLNELKNLSIIMNATGVYAGDTILFDAKDLPKTITNINQWVIESKSKNNVELIFTSCFLGYLSKTSYFERIKDISNGGMITNEHLKHWIKIPEFPDELQKEIAVKYYNKVESKAVMSLDTYLEKEKERNSLLGIWQLNMELFTLKEQVEELVRKIVYSEEINISDYL